MYYLRITYIILAAFSLPLFSNDWQVDKQADNKVTFYSSTPLLDFDGYTNQIDGYVYWEGDTLFGANNEIYFEVQLASFETGIGKRDSDMREDVLQTAKYPLAFFKGSLAKVEKENSAYTVIVKGKMRLHGQTREIEIPGQLSLSEDNINVKSTFVILLKDYQIEAPELFAFIKVSQEIKIVLDFNLKEVK